MDFLYLSGPMRWCYSLLGGKYVPIIIVQGGIDVDSAGSVYALGPIGWMGPQNAERRTGTCKFFRLPP